LGDGQFAEMVPAGSPLQLFPDHQLASRPMNVVYLPDRYRSPKLRSFVDFLVEWFN
jgi:DNA-binding transcriptional LysR family regulator